MTADFQKIKDFYNACRPEEPVSPTDPRWVDLSQVRGSGLSTVASMLRQIDLESKFVTLLLTGFRGTGKTSLLYALQKQLEERAYYVVYTDAEGDYLVKPHEEININDVLLTLAMAIVDQGLGPSYLARLWEDVEALAGSLARISHGKIEKGCLFLA